LKRRERISARLGDVYSQLYLSSTTLWYFEKMGAKKEDLPLVHWALQRSLFDAQESFDAMRQNHPLGWVMWLLMFPLGGVMRSAPSDKMDSKVAELLTEPNDIRDRLSDGIFKPTDTNQQLGVLEKAFE